MEAADRIRELAEQLKKDDSQFIVEVLVSLKRIPHKVLVILDGDNGVTIEDCADLNRALSDALDKENLLEGRYVLEVSTPGLDHPLKFMRQYRKNKGRTLKVKTHEATLEGTLSEITEHGITLQQQSGSGKKRTVKDVVIPFSSIEKAFVLVSFK